MNFDKRLMNIFNKIQRFNPSSKFDAQLPPEYEESSREMKLWLYRRPINFGSSSNAGSSAPSSNKDYTSHWMLVFKYADGTVRMIEGVNNNGVLEPNFAKSHDSYWTKDRLLASGQISPKAIRELAVNNPHNGTSYSLLNNNCQSWANKILEILGIQPVTNTVQKEIMFQGFLFLVTFIIAFIVLVICCDGKNMRRSAMVSLLAPIAALTIYNGANGVG